MTNFQEKSLFGSVHEGNATTIVAYSVPVLRERFRRRYSLYVTGSGLVVHFVLDSLQKIHFVGHSYARDPKRPETRASERHCFSASTLTYSPKKGNRY